MKLGIRLIQAVINIAMLKALNIEFSKKNNSHFLTI